MAGVQPNATLAGYYAAAAAKFNLPVGLLIAQGRQESGFQTDVVSPAGAIGIAQLMPATAAGLGVNPRDPQAAIMAQAQLMRSYVDQFGGNVADALAAYNAGPGAVQQYGGVPPYQETQDYVNAITAAAASDGTSTSTSGKKSGGGFDWNPLNWPGDAASAVTGAVSDAVNSAFSAILDTLKPIMISGILLAGGVVLIGAGAWRSVSSVRTTADEALDPAGGAG